MTPSHLEPLTDVGAYVLGALEAEEASEFEAHMKGCQTCVEEAVALSEVALALAEFARTEPDLDELLPGTPHTGVPAPASRRRHLFALAASVALFAGGAAVGGTLDSDEEPAHQHPAWAAELLLVGELHSAENPTNHVTAKVGLESKNWGTHVALELRGVAGPLDCDLVAVSTSGARHTVTSWLVPEPGYGVPGKPEPLQVHGGAALRRGDIARFEVVTRSGASLVTIPV
ncbi:zf-HC2 domain-containing protein [Streptomyces sp. NPDC056632]|uniref:zf-HC2 domain-containing protein n=1 Tax=Streptomyces sp. NPDC056632 TaxID=3345884 RepID=UPI0036B08E11